MVKAATLRSFSLRKNFVWTFSSNIVYGFVQWCIVIIIARYGTPELVGQFSLATGIVLPVFAFFNFHLRVVYVTSSLRNPLFTDYLWLRLCTSVAALLIIFIIALFFEYDNSLLLIAVSYGVVRGAEALSDIFFAPAQRAERMNVMSLSIMLRSLVSLLIVLCAIKYKDSLALAIIFMAVWELCVAAVLDYRIAAFFTEIRGTIQINRFKKIIRKSYPLGAAMGLTLLIGTIPRFIVEHYLGIKQVGYFSAIQYFYVASGMVITAINSASIPRLSKYYTEGKRPFFYLLLRKLFVIGFVFGCTSIVLSVVLGKFVLEFFYAVDYGCYSRELVIIIIAASVQYLVAIAASGILAMNRFWDMVYVLLAGLIAIVIMGIVFVVQFSMMGAVYAMLASSVLQFLVVLFFLYVRKSEFIPPA